METFSTLLALCEGNPPVTDGFLSQRPVTRCFDIFFDLHLTKPWVNNRDDGDLRHHHVHYDITVMVIWWPFGPDCVDSVLVVVTHWTIQTIFLRLAGPSLHWHLETTIS